MKQDIKIPAVGESITEATIAVWNKNSGDYIHRDEAILTLETDKASVDVVAEHSGELSIQVKQGETVEVGAVIGSIDTSIKEAPPLQKKAPPLSPAVRKIVSEKKLDPNLQGAGKGGRLTKAEALAATPPPTPSLHPQTTQSTKMETRREPMSPLRKTIAKRLVQAQQTAAILTTFNEIDMTQVIELRKKYKESFKEKYGVSLGFMGLFIKATVTALKTYPRVNASIQEDQIILKNFVNMGIAVSTDKGLLVPVIRQADQLSVSDIELSIHHYASKARNNTISIDDLSDGSFTISNGGVFGSLMSTPILNPPQSGILGLHKIEERPIAIQSQVVIRPMMYVALSYDHRIIDGKESVGFLVKIKEGIEDPSRLLLDI